MSLHHWHRLARRWSGWLLAALLLATLAPAVSRALPVGGAAAGAGEHRMALCTSEGMQWVAADPTAAGDEAPAADPDALDRCGLCTLAAERFAPLVPASLLQPFQATPWPVPDLAPPVPASAQAHAACARGPPLL